MSNPRNVAMFIREARELLGEAGLYLTDSEIEKTLVADDSGSLEDLRRELIMKRDARALATLIYNIYKEKRYRSNDEIDL